MAVTDRRRRLAVAARSVAVGTLALVAVLAIGLDLAAKQLALDPPQ